MTRPEMRALSDDISPLKKHAADNKSGQLIPTAANAVEHPANILLRQRFYTLESRMEQRRYAILLATLAASLSWTLLFLAKWAPLLHSNSVGVSDPERLREITIWIAAGIVTGYGLVLLAIYAIIDRLLLSRDGGDIETELEACRKRLIEPLESEEVEKVKDLVVAIAASVRIINKANVVFHERERVRSALFKITGALLFLGTLGATLLPSLSAMNLADATTRYTMIAESVGTPLLCFLWFVLAFPKAAFESRLLEEVESSYFAGIANVLADLRARARSKTGREVTIVTDDGSQPSAEFHAEDQLETA